MPVTVASLEPQVCSRLEESYPNPVFWDLTHEIRPLIVEAMFEAALITGEPEVRLTSQTTITADSNIQTMPENAIAIIRMQGPKGMIRKTSVKDLDWIKPNWQMETGPNIKHWFPIGLSSFGVYPKLQSEVQVVLSIVELPVVSSRPYTGNETADFQQEYTEAFDRYAAAALRLKEGGPEFQQGLLDYEYFLAKMSELSKFGERKHALRFTRTMGHTSQVTPVEKR